MAAKRHISICREGWYYLFVLAFIVGGAVLRQINLLIILSGLMMGPMVFNWRLVAATLRRLDVRRKLPERVCVGDPLMVDLVVSNHRRRLASWTVVVRDSIKLQNAPSRGYQTKVEALVAHVPAGGSSQAAYRCHLNRRGVYRFGPLRVSTKFPLGLIRAAMTVKQFDELIVCPKLGRLTGQWKQMIEAERVGAKRSRQRRALNEGGDFYGVRDWRPGDSERWIHWRASAKLSDLAVRQFEQQRTPDLTLVLDLYRSEEPSAEELEGIEFAISFAATVISDACRRGDSRLNVVTCGKTVARFEATTSIMLMYQVLEHLAVVEGGDGAELPGVLEQVLDQITPGTRPVVISTRPSWPDDAVPASDDPRRQVNLERLTWIDAAGDDVSGLFELD